ncbi:MAG: serine/threonine protein kinase [Xanthomonadales bacterium]|nr:serine/threonine protein kinase [Gammaproteobacteria bacterium]MBT8054303.1 serine/threonine protein kinase [Gammaproteobacteria bacterium]NND57504.1 serine/threonine protein kinase [Xanthomonadales bacterium]
MKAAATDPTPYYRLDPDTVLHAVDTAGLITDGRLLALNSYENRVYQVGIEETDPVIAKFYRPGRWTDEQILEEHAFSLELAEAEIPLIAPSAIEGHTLFHHDGFRFALFRRQGGHAPELEDRETRMWLGRFIGRIHAVARSRPFAFRPALTPERFGCESVATVVDGQWLPPHMEDAFESLADDLMMNIRAAFERAGEVQSIRLHGDCHPGNLLWRDGPYFVDMDDCQSGPAVQDLWMLLSGERAEMEAQLADIVEGYCQFCDFDVRELQLVEALRTLRMLHHAAWLARRWEDPAFPIAFPWFDSPRYWEDLVLSLREQLSALQEPALQLR